MEYVLEIIRTLKGIPGLLTSLAAIITALVAFLKFFQYKTRRDKLISVGTAFHSIVSQLSSDLEAEKLSAAILLRRFFDPETEMGIGNTPYAKEAVNVIAAILRSQPSGNFQKLLADGLGYAPNLHRIDLQRTNLQNAYLGQREQGAAKIDLSGADFYRADLSGASLKGAIATGAIFYQARLQNTVLKQADLRKANFFEADLLGARFDGAMLGGAIFKDARNIPLQIAENLDEEGTFPEGIRVLEQTGGTQPASLTRVFVSKPGILDERQKQATDFIFGVLKNHNMVAETLERKNYPTCGSLAEVGRIMGGCSGLVVFGFRQLEIFDGEFRPHTVEQRRVSGMYLPTEWNQIETGMAAMNGLPILLIVDSGVDCGVFEQGLDDYLLYRVNLETDPNSKEMQQLIENWCAAVREKSKQ